MLHDWRALLSALKGLYKKPFVGALGSRALRVLIIGLKWWGGLAPMPGPWALLPREEPKGRPGGPGDLKQLRSMRAKGDQPGERIIVFRQSPTSCKGN